MWEMKKTKQKKLDWDYCQTEIEGLHLRVQELEGAMQEFVDNHKLIMESDDPTKCIVKWYYENKEKFKQLLEK